MSLDGLESITSMDSLTIDSNNNLLNVTGLLAISGSVLYLLITNNSSLININGLNNITRVENELLIANNSSLEHLDGLENISTVENLTIAACRNLTSLDGLDNLSEVRYNFRIEDTGMRQIEEFDSLTKLFNLTIRLNLVLDSVNAFNNVLGSVNQVSIFENISLDELEIFNSAEIVEGVRIFDNASLDTMNNFHSTSRINTIIYISDNPNLFAINSFENLNSLGTSLSIINNIRLMDFCSLTNLATVGSIKGEYIVTDNDFNPTLEDLQTGNCSI